MKRLPVPLFFFAVWFFPVWWTAASVAQSGPSVMQAALARRPLDLVRVGFGGARAVVATSGEAPRRSARWRGWSEWLVPAAAVLILLLWRHPLAGLCAACAGLVALTTSLPWLLLGELTRSWTRSVLVLCCLGAIVAGLRAMLLALSTPGRWERLALLSLGFGVPGVAVTAVVGVPMGVVTALAVLTAAALPSGEPIEHPPGWRAAGVGAGVTVLLCAGLSAAQPWNRGVDGHAVPAARTVFFQKGVNLTAEYPDGYDSRRIAGLLDDLKKFGVDAVALVPYGFSAPGSARVSFGGGNTMESDEGIADVAAEAHRRGMRVLLKPQIWTGRGFTGDLDYREPVARGRWFTDYGRFIDHYTAVATRIHADLLAVGVEFGRLSVYEREWRGIIARARRGYTGPLTYAANFGPEFEDLRFWDALDYIGLNNYYPLPDDLRTDSVVARVEAVARRSGKPVIFTEVGFPSVVGANREPWAEPRRALSPQAQAECYEAVFRAFYDKPWFAGMYWWKVGTSAFGGTDDGSNTPWRKPAMEVVGRWYRRDSPRVQKE